MSSRPSPSHPQHAMTAILRSSLTTSLARRPPGPPGRSRGHDLAKRLLSTVATATFAVIPAVSMLDKSERDRLREVERLEERWKAWERDEQLAIGSQPDGAAGALKEPLPSSSAEGGRSERPKGDEGPRPAPPTALALELLPKLALPSRLKLLSSPHSSTSNPTNKMLKPVLVA